MIRSIPEGSQPFGARQPSLALQGFLAGSSAIPPGSIESFRRPFRWDRCAQPPANGCDPSGIIGMNHGSSPNIRDGVAFVAEAEGTWRGGK